MEPLNVWDYERLAAERMDPAAYGYYVGGAGDEWTLRENRAAFDRWVLRPRVLVDVARVSTATTVLGHEVSMPLLVAPTAWHRFAHDEGEKATARAAAAAGTIMCLSSITSVPPADVARVAPAATRWFQVYVFRDRGFTRDYVRSAAEAGYSALMVTADLPVVGRRERDFRLGLEVPDASGTPPLQAIDPTLSWRDLEWLAGYGLPLVVKGILTAEDALLACEHGAAGVVVSNHGGRQLDGVPASVDALPEVADAVGDRCEIYLDSGIRRGVDVLKTLALGARAALVGRPVLWGLAVAGEEGVAHVLELLRAEIELGLALLGCASPAEVSRSHVRSAHRAASP